MKKYANWITNFQERNIFRLWIVLNANQTAVCSKTTKPLFFFLGICFINAAKELAPAAQETVGGRCQGAVRASHGCGSGSGLVRGIRVGQPQGGCRDGDRLRPGQVTGPTGQQGRGQAQASQWSCCSRYRDLPGPGCTWPWLPHSMVGSSSMVPMGQSLEPALPGEGRVEEQGARACRMSVLPGKKRSYSQNKREACMGYLIVPFGSCYSKCKEWV